MLPINDSVVLRMLRRKLDSAKVNLLDWEIARTEEEEIKLNVNSATLRFIAHYQFNGEEFHERFFAKVPVCSDTYDKNRKLGFLENELMVYEKVLPQLNRVAHHLFAPVLYYSCRKDYTLIMEDLTSTGYAANFDQQFGLEDGLLVLRELGKFHAASAKVLQIRVDVFDWLNSKFVDESALFSQSAARQMIGRRFQRVVLRVDPRFWRENADRLEDYREHLFELNIAERLSRRNLLNVLNHGDCWTSNVMLREGAERVKFVDFQSSLVGSPAVDVFFFVMSSVRFEVFEQNGRQLLETYVDALNEGLLELECGLVYSVDQLRREIDERCSFWMFVLVFWMPMIFSSAAEIRERTATDDGLLDGDTYAKVADKWMSYFIRRCQEHPELRIFCNTLATKS